MCKTIARIYHQSHCCVESSSLDKRHRTHHHPKAGLNEAEWRCPICLKPIRTQHVVGPVSLVDSRASHVCSTSISMAPSAVATCKTFHMARVEMMVHALLSFRQSIRTTLSEQATCFHIRPTEAFVSGSSGGNSSWQDPGSCSTHPGP